MILIYMYIINWKTPSFSLGNPQPKYNHNDIHYIKKHNKFKSRKFVTIHGKN
jgi:hypothetical protein